MFGFVILRLNLVNKYTSKLACVVQTRSVEKSSCVGYLYLEDFSLE